MSEVIVRMEFRKNCLDCDLRQIVYGDSYADTDVYCSKENRFVGKRFGSTKDLARPDWCPIIGVLPPEHGRLIDAKHFEVVSYTENEVEQAGYCWRSFDDGVEWLLNQVDATPTIVPATERSER